ncbi:DTW domain-containing protein [Pelagicoccus enzymogenes]|uniref:tRNA-uridine aminocarboxypropyltransferase n=1 Tax=Pelagicoccus enzymogenes TaxID=2773457 RepID=UPI00280E107E|nr:tRNA-uridine aminocarboxypropyltransferase [Pelagicoccus enzymogenes]MDQ8200989.1 DTW domain-containing protein [Pelagicoccus enzymogenes]
MCYQCNRPRQLCWCGKVTPMPTRTKIVILMHPYEHRHVKLNTGRLTHLCLADSELHVGEDFDRHSAVRALIEDPANFPVLLYPGKGARDLSKGELRAEELGERRLVVFLLDGTWRLARGMLRFSECLQGLPKVMFSNAAPSRYVIKRQPEAGCLSTLEAAHELLLALERSGLDEYKDQQQMLDLFMEMQAFQLKCEQANRRPDFVPRSKRTSEESRYNPSKRRKVF